ncbi:MAG: response regulator transcription factor [Bacillota bacterium]|nr:response regulator transcription factor [Bacillota bacterium]
MRILIVDDDALIRDGLKMILENEDGFEVVGSAVNGKDALNLCRVVHPDIVLMDIRMPVMDGVEATRYIKEHFSSIKVLLLTTFKDVEYIRNAIKYGAEGYVLKSNSSESIIEGIKAVFQGNVVYEKEVARLISGMMEKDEKISWTDLNITPKEYEIMDLVSKGMSNREISEKLYMSEGTIRNYISTLLDKLELRDRTQLAIFFIRKLEK